MAAICGMSIGPQLLKALGLQGQRVRTIDIHVSVKEPVIVKTESLMDDGQARELMSVVQEYTLTPRHSIISDFNGWFASALERSGVYA